MVLFAALVFIIKGKGSVIISEDVLDGILVQFRVMKNEKLFFAHDKYASFLGGIDRDFLPSEFKLYTMLYMLFPPLFAYFSGKLLTVALALAGTVLLFKDILKEDFKLNAPSVCLLGFAYGLISFPAEYSFGFASLPLLAFLLRKTAMADKLKPLWFIALFFYPVLGYFSQTGLAVLVFLLVYFILRCIRKKKFSLNGCLSFILLLLGYAGTEYRLFYELFFEDNTYAEVMHKGLFDMPGGVWGLILWSFVKALPYIGIFLLFAVLAGIFVHINQKNNKAGKPLALLSAVIVLLALLTDTGSGNDLTETLKGGTDFRGYYSEALFEKAKEDIGYDGEWAVAYGLTPAVLNYNGISTLDGRFDFYSANYKDYFRMVIAPYLDSDEESDRLFEEGGAECYVPGTGGTLDIDLNRFKYLGGRYVFSNGELSNAGDLGLSLVNSYNDGASPYQLFVYITTSRYQDKLHSDIPFDERPIAGYDVERLHEAEDTVNALVDEINAFVSEKGLDTENKNDISVIKSELKEKEMLNAYDVIVDELSAFRTSYSIAQLHYYMDVTDEEMGDLQNDIYEEFLDEADKAQATIREICSSPYASSMRRVMGRAMINAFSEYEDMTDEEKDRSLKIQSLQQEYDQASIEDYYYEYNGELWSYDELVERADELTRSSYFEIYQGIGREKAGVLGEIYLELLALEKETAENEDYDNYAEYAYEEVYVRDYDTEDARKLLADIRKKGGISYIRRIAELAENAGTEYGYITEDDTETYEMLLPYMEEIAPELGQSLKHLLDCGLYDLKESDKKPNVGFTTALPSYGDAFIFNSPYLMTQDLYTYVHEFGHYSNAYYSNENLFESFDNIDIAEIHSQGLEMLFTDFYDELYGEEMGKDLELGEVYSICSGLPDMAIITEFELYAHQNPDKSIDELSKKYCEIMKDYGYDIPSEIEAMYTWVDIPHIYNSPCYYISYLTSALSSLEIYTLADEDREDAINKYMEITTYPTRSPYSAVMEETGLSDVFKSGTVRNILKETYRILKKNVGA